MISTLCLSLLVASAEAWTPHTRSLKNATGLMPRWLPESDKFRGVNLGSSFIIEQWMANDEWNDMGCGGTNDEWACVESLGQEAADAAFKTHWESWVTQDDIDEITSLGLNTIRIPVGFWINEDLVNDGEHYPRGGLEHLDRLVGQAKDAGLYVLMDLHGGPGSQSPNQQFTGHGVDEPGFYTDENFGRAADFLSWMTKRIHSNDAYSNVGMLQVMNEPVHAGDYPDEAANMIANFYPQALKAIRDAESAANVGDSDRLHVQFMGEAWGSGDPTSNLPDTDFTYYDDHRYYKWDQSVETTKDGYINAVCSDDRGDGDILIGEWSISVSDDVQDNDEFTNKDGQNADWYKDFFAAQVQTFEKSGGWIFWTWKCNYITGYDEWRWCYKSAHAAGVIPDDASKAAGQSPC